MKSDMTKGSIGKHIRSIAIPASIGFLFNTLFNVVDTFYAGQLSTEALSGLTISFPVFIIILSIASGLGNGLSALMSNSIGKKDLNKFHSFILNGLFISLIFGFFLMILAPFIIPFLFNITGVKGESLEYGLQYTNTIFFGSLFFIFNFVLNSILQSQGNSKPFRNYLMLGFFLNLILDPMFIFGWFGLPKMGTAGVAIATIIVQAIGTIYLFYEVRNSELFDFKKFKSQKISFKRNLEILKQGIPAGLNLATIAIGIFIINFYVLKYGGVEGIAAYGSSIRIQQVALLPTIGLNFAIISIVGQNFGAKKLDRVDKTKSKALKYGLIMATIGGLLLFVFAPNLVSIFDNNQNVINIGTTYLRIDTVGFLTYIILNVHISTLQGLKKPSYGLWIALFRQLTPIVVFPFLAEILKLNLNGVWIGIVTINWIATFIIIFITLKIQKEIASKEELSTNS